MTGSQMVSSRSFPTFAEAVDYANKQPIESVIEIKKYDDTVNNIQDKPNNFGPY
jgi:hypothetical protein